MYDDQYTFHENTRQVIGRNSRKIYSLGDRVRVTLDRVDSVERRLQFAFLEDHPSPKHRPGQRKVKSKARDKDKNKVKAKGKGKGKNKGKRRRK